MRYRTFALVGMMGVALLVSAPAGCMQFGSEALADEGPPETNAPAAERSSDPLFRPQSTTRTYKDVSAHDGQPAAYQLNQPPRPYSMSTEQHVEQAIEHLEAAGLNELADRTRAEAARIARAKDLTNKRKQLAAIEQQVKRLEAEIARLEAGDQPADRDGNSGKQEAPGPKHNATQVVLKMRLLEISHNALRKLGVNFQGSLYAGLITEGDRQATTGRPAFVALEPDNALFSFLEGLVKAKTGVKILAEPVMVAVPGRPASFHSGGEIEVPVPQLGKPDATETMKFGTQAEVLAHDLGQGRLRLEVRMRVSELDTIRTTTFNDREIPGLSVREFATTAELEAGRTLVMGGLTRTRKSSRLQTEAEREAPFSASDDIELMFLVTPTFVTPDEVDTLPYLPKTAVRPNVDSTK